MQPVNERCKYKYLAERYNAISTRVRNYPKSDDLNYPTASLNSLYEFNITFLTGARISFRNRSSLRLHFENDILSMQLLEFFKMRFRPKSIWLWRSCSIAPVVGLYAQVLIMFLENSSRLYVCFAVLIYLLTNLLLISELYAASFHDWLIIC